ncbi:hypothetical protein [Pseudomonas sp. BJa3]|uniref:hypothetical protein n=1 Tax=Pseudomonas sp. BJa3 TaxID=2986525 RepID=UPI002265C482|nr:hypothetical protein [Pseudomonas sp. BJa3]MCX5510448.1 hypothetical protein [Pseudomonas sp. BJa3]
MEAPAIRGQRRQARRRHYGQLQQLQPNLQQPQHTLAVRTDELTMLNRDNQISVRRTAKAAVRLSTPDGMSAIEFVKDQKTLERVMGVLAQMEHGYP